MIDIMRAEGLSTGELKRSKLALEKEDDRVVNDYTFSETLSNAIEAKARRVYHGVSDIENELYDTWTNIRKVDQLFNPMISIAPIHLLAYHIMKEGGKDPDKPRNLAKSVTVK